MASRAALGESYIFHEQNLPIQKCANPAIINTMTMVIEVCHLMGKVMVGLVVEPSAHEVDIL